MKTAELIKTWVAENFGQSEVDDPSWNIEALADYIDENQEPKHLEPEFYMVIAGFEDCVRENLEVVDYNLTLKEAKKLASTIQNNDDEFIDVDVVKIVPQAEKI